MGPQSGPIGFGSDHALRQHGISYFHKAGDVRALDVVDLAVSLFTVVNTGMVNRLHDVVQLAVHFTGRPQQAHGVLRHLQARHGHAASVGRLARSVQDARLQEDIHSLEGGRHVGAFGHAEAAIAQQGAGVFGVQLVLRGARQGDVTRQAPRGLALAELQAELARQGAEATTLDVFQLHHGVPLGVAQARFGVQGALGIGKRDDLAAPGP